MTATQPRPDVDRYQAVFRHLMMPCCVIDAQGRVLAWNAAMSSLTQMKGEQAIGERLNTLDPISQAICDHWQQVSQHGTVNRSQITFGEHRYDLSFVKLLPSEEWAIMVEDRHQVIHHEQENDNIFYTIIHDLQNPLSAIKGYTELVKTFGPLNEQQGFYHDRILTAIQDMRTLISHMLDIAWVDAGTKPRLTPVNLAHLASQLSSGFANQAAQNGVNLQVEVEHVAPVLADDRRIQQVIRNLIGNAVKYSPNGGDVIVRVFQEDNAVIFSVRDQGIGIPKDHQAQIFKRFYRVPAEYTQGIEGNGLGLAICFEILQKHKSTLQFESTYGEGSHFQFELPTHPNTG